MRVTRAQAALRRVPRHAYLLRGVIAYQATARVKGPKATSLRLTRSGDDEASARIIGDDFYEA